MPEITPADLKTELDVLLRRAGVSLPPEPHDAILAVYADLRAQIALLHSKRPATSEPSNVYRMTLPGTAS